MADCKVILECCGGQTQCNEKVTIGYLKAFIMSGATYLLKTTAGTDVQVTSSKPDTYEPTYGELINGSILPLYIDGGNNSGASSVDGIIIEGTHASNETIRKIDLSLAYVRFKSLSISASKITFDKCGDNATIQYTYTLTKTVKAISQCEPLTYSYAQSDVYDTTNLSPNNITFNAGCDWITINGSTISAGQNGTGHSVSRNCVITATLAYKGNTEEANNSITITQPLVGGEWVQYDTSYDSISVDVYGSDEYGCDGGSFSIEGTGHYTKLYYWKDDCGNEYRDVTSSTTHSETAGTDYGSFPDCPNATNQTKILSVSWHGLTGSHTFTQTCTCNACENSRDYGSCEYNNSGDASSWAEACGGNFQVCCNMPITTHTRTWVDGVCVDTTGKTSENQCATIVIPDNTSQVSTSHTGSVMTEEGGTINYTVWQKAGPCGGCIGETHRAIYPSEVSKTIDACDTVATFDIPYTAITEYDNCSSIIEEFTATTSYTVSKNESSSYTSYTKTYDGLYGESVTVIINQNPGPCTCLCNMLTVTPTAYNWTYDKTSSDTHDITISSADCTTGISVNTLTHFNATVGNNKITVSPKGINASSYDYVETLVISYKADGTNCSSSVTLTQTVEPDPCSGKSCNELTVTSTTTSWNYYSHYNVNIIGFDASDCVSNITASSDSSWLRVSADTSTNKVKGSMSYQGCETSDRTANVTLSWEVDGNSCSTTYAVTQSGDSTPCFNPCVCSNFSANTTNLVFDYEGSLKTSFRWRKNGDCDSDFTLSGDSHVNSATLNSNGTITISVDENDNLDSQYTGSVRVMLGSTACTTLNYSVEARPCNCSDLGEPEVVTTSIPYSGSDKFVVWKVEKNDCIDKIEATSGSCGSLFSSVGTGISGSYYVVSASVSSNQSSSNRSCTVGYKLYAIDNSYVCNSGSTAVTVSRCDCTASNIRLGNLSGVPSSGGSEYHLPYTANCGTIHAWIGDSNDNVVGWARITAITSDEIYFSVDENTSEQSRSAYINVGVNTSGTGHCPYKYKSFTQSRFVCNCDEANITVDTTAHDLDASESSNNNFEYSNECGTVTATTNASWIDITGTDNGEVTFNVSANTSTTSSRSSTIKVFLVGYNNCSSSVTVNQEASACTCSNANLTVGTSTVTVSSGSSSNNTISFSNSCGTVSAMATSGNGWITITNVSNNRVYFSASSNVGGAARSGTIRVYLDGYSGSCYANVTVSQPIGYDCSSLSVSGSNSISSAATSHEIIGQYSGNYGQFTSLSCNVTWLKNLDASGGYIYADVDANCGAERDAIISISYFKNGPTCTPKQVTVKQLKGGYSGISASTSSLTCSGGIVTFSPIPR